tara:strand:- start:1075 stop:1383 length:309 start_codon:yes stop_codon:yes gene_type:complete
MYKRILYLFLLTLFSTSCADTFDSVKRGLTGQKKNTADEFLVKKKDPLTLPPDFENLPSPEDKDLSEIEVSTFEKNLENAIEEETGPTGSIEDSIIKKIQKK